MIATIRRALRAPFGNLVDGRRAKRSPSTCERLERRCLLAAAANDAFTLNEDGSFTINDPALLANDVDIGSILGFTQPARGTLTREAGRFIYRPAANFNGTDSFTYTGRSFTNAGRGATLYLSDGDLNGDGRGVGVGGGEVPVLIYNWSVENPGLPGAIPGAPSTGRAAAGRFNFVVPMNAASPGFLAAVANGGTVDRLTLVQRGGAGGAAAEVIRWTLFDARFLDYRHADGPSVEPVPTEQFAVSFARVEVRVTPPPGGVTSQASFNPVLNTSSGSGDFPLNTAPANSGLFLEAKTPSAALAGFAGFVPIDSLGFEVSNPGSAPGGGTARSQFNDIQVTLDGGGGASAAFFRSAVSGDGWGEVVLVARRRVEGGAFAETVRYILRNARVTSFSAAGEGDASLQDSVRFTYGSIETAVTLYSPIGAPLPAVRASWDRARDTGTGGADFGRQNLSQSPPTLLLDLGTGHVEVDDYSWEENNLIPPPGVPGGGRVEFDSFTFHAPLGLASPGLFAAAADQRAVPLVGLTRRMNTGRLPVRWELTAARVNSFATSVGPDGEPVSTFSLAPLAVKQTVDFFNPDLPTAVPVTTSWDLRTGTGQAPANFGFRNFGAIPGYVLDFGTGQGQLEVLDYSWGVGNELGVPPGIPAGRPSVDAFTFTAPTGQASAALLFRVASGSASRISRLDMVGRRVGPGGTAVEFIRYTFHNVAFGRYAASDAGPGDVPTDTFTAHFDRVDVTHTPASPTGGPGTPLIATIDALRNTASGSGAFPSLAPLSPAQESAAGNRLQAIGPQAPLRAGEAGAVDVTSFSFDLSGETAGLAEFAPVTVLLNSTQASGAFLRSAATGGRWSQVVLTSAAGGGFPFVQTRWTLGGATVVSYSTVAGQRNEPPTEVITLAYDTISIATTTVGNDGRPLPPVVTGWDLVRNVPTGQTPNGFGGRQIAPTAFVADFGTGDVEVESFEWGESNSESAPGGSGGIVRFEEFTLTARTGSASAALFRSAAGGAAVPGRVTFTGRSVGTAGSPLATWTLEGVRVVGYSSAVDADNPAVDSFRLRASKVTQVFNQVGVGGGVTALPPAFWDTNLNNGTRPANFGRQVLSGSFTTHTATVNLTVRAVNDAPSAITLSNTTLADPFDGQTVGTLTATDPDAGDAVTLSLTNNAAGRFVLVGNQLRVANAALISGNASYPITARAADRAGAFIDRTFTVTVPVVHFTPGGVLTVNGGSKGEVFTFTRPTPTTVTPVLDGSPMGVYSPSRVIVNGGVGNDFIDASNLTIPVTLRGGPGDDTLTGGSAADGLIGGAGNDRLTGGPGADQVFGNDGNDVAVGDGLDVIDLGAGQDGIEYRGTDGADQIVIDVRIFRLPDDPHPELSDAEFADAARLGLVAHGHFAVMRLNGALVENDYLGGETIFVFAGGGDDVVSVTPGGGRHWRMELNGEAGDDRLSGEATDDLLRGGPGNDDLSGGDGDDTLDGGTGADLFRGQGGRDTADYSDRTRDLFVGAGRRNDDGEEGEGDNVGFDVETIIGGSGDDMLRGGDGPNLLDGRGGNDKLYGFAGHDTLFGGDGRDQMFGGDGDDTLDGGRGADRFVGGAGTDAADYSNRTEDLFVGVGRLADDGAFGEGDNVGFGIENLIGGSGDDILRGRDGPNRLEGRGGNDKLFGFGGRDVLLGDSGDDRLFARDSAVDSLDGGPGFDRANRDDDDQVTGVEEVLP